MRTQGIARAPLLFLAATSLHWLPLCAGAEPPDMQAGFEFFEKKIRPLLSENCFACHGPAKQKSGLRLDTRAGLLAGGEIGVVVVPGKPEESRLIRAVRYEDPDLQMPPRGKLDPEKIADLVHWIELGAPWPDDAAPPPATPANPAAAPFDLDARKKKHWAWQPIAPIPAPSIRDTAWPRTDVDRFILARLEKENLRPAADASRQTLIRRATFDLTGLPPKPEEIAAFVNDPAPDAWEKAVDRLLASPAFGERWGRHWLDLVRYAESFGHEQDFPILEAWRYRDYVIRAFNADVPYDEFLTEHLAGDLLPHPRRNPDLDFNESIIGTGFWFMGQATHAPVDSLQDEADRMDNQVDVFSKTFLGLTVGCARCHDHKFDAISTRDYYGLIGYMKSSRRQYAPLDMGGNCARSAAEMRSLRAEASREYVSWLRSLPDNAHAGFANYLSVAREMNLHSWSFAAEGAAALGLNASRVQAWARALDSPELDAPDHPMHVWRELTQGPCADDVSEFQLRAAVWSDARKVSAQPEKPNADKVFEDFNGERYAGWSVSGEAFGAGPSHNRDWSAVTNAAVPGGVAHSGRESRKLRGVLCSRTFQIEKPTILYRVAAEGGVIRLVVDSYTMRDFHDLLFKDMHLEVNTGGKFVWINQTKDVARYIGHRAHIEIEDPGDGYIAVDEIRFSDNPPAAEADEIEAELSGHYNPEKWNSPSDLARAYESIAFDALKHWGEEKRPGSGLVIWLGEHGLLEPKASLHKLDGLRQEIKRIEDQCPIPPRALAIADRDGEDARVYIRGSSKNPGDLAPRRFLEAVAGTDQSPPAEGSGRLDLARRILDPLDPFPARVMINRIWEHLFGRGIVATPDNFGALGEAATHPELLDHLADRFRRDGWSVKKMIRYLMLSRAYQMQAVSLDSASEEKDPANMLLHRMRVKRLEGEAVRDAILAVSGRLDPHIGGEPIPIFMTPFMDGRNPPPAGPLDGDGRRSIYLAERRNYLSPMLLAFDLPIPDTTAGRRNVSNVPAQALILMNDPFVKAEARRWAQRVAEEAYDPLARVQQMYNEALGRSPTQAEAYQALAFVAAQSKAWNDADIHDFSECPETQPWSDLAQVIFMLKEFIFIA